MNGMKKKALGTGLVGVTALALAACTGGGGTSASPSTSASASASPSAKVYSDSDLQSLVSGLKDSDGNDLKPYSKDQVNTGKDLGKVLLSTATVDPSDCKSIATAGLVNSVDNGSVAVAISDSQKPRTVSAQSGSEGPDSQQVLKDIEGKMGTCAKFTVSALGQKVTVSSKQLQATTDAAETFGTVSTRGDNSSDMLMQVSGAQGRLLVVATKSGGNLGDTDQHELEGLVNDVLHKATGSSTSSTSSPSSSMTSSSSTSTETSSPSSSSTSSSSETSGMSSSPSSSASPSAS
ncbi:hypothetical protein J2W20_002205 [Sinomonas atrocyanea]|uniref:hypothetical protein n=2 Tax=Sinomonas atrocyanea TaxID=37927 RepID=UPI0027877B04|nr:hypothetical protein [Sinomonas atrocyanea]MDQ0260301.1 hypothetical protein [Sinomonas atrocyanea]MDR6622469.1 hypothetical protein [Sinomonas atrocyanea]